MQSKGRTQQCRHALRLGAEIAQPHTLELKRNRVRRRPFWLACRRTVSSDGEIRELLGRLERQTRSQRRLQRPARERANLESYDLMAHTLQDLQFTRCSSND